MDFSLTVLSWLAGVTLRSLVLAAAVWPALLLFRVRSAASRHAVWTVVTAAMIALAVLTPLLPPLPLHVLHASLDPVTLPANLPPVPAGGLHASAAVSAAPAPVTTQFGWPLVALVVYAAGAAGFLVRLSFGYLFVGRLERAASPIHHPWAAEMYESSWISVPLTVGWLRPRILLPAGWEQWESSKLQAVLAHEQTHVQRADWAIAALAGVNRCIFWFHPLAWWLENQLATLAEQACDDSALLLVSTESYAQALLDMAAAVKTCQGRLIWEAMAMAKAAEVRKRIERILDETRQIPRALTAPRWLALVACSLPLVYVASVVQLAPAQTPTPATISELLKNKRQLGPGDVGTMEQYLAANPQDLEVRNQLVLYYFSKGIREPRLTHIMWMIANHPESNAAVFASRGITVQTSSYNDAADFTRAANLWKQAAASHATDPKVLSHAAQFFSQPGADYDEAERLLLAERALDPSNLASMNQLGKLYATAILENSGDPRFPNSNPGFANRVKEQLENSTDGWLLHFAGTVLAGAAERPQPGKPLAPGVLNLDEHPALVPAVELGNRLISRSRDHGVPAGFGMATGTLTAAREGAVRVLPPPPPPPPPPAAGTGSSEPVVLAPVPPQATTMAAPPVVNRVDPVYPPLAQQARIQGTVQLQVTIDTNGRVDRLTVLRGHPLLVSSALEAVRQWSYAPGNAGTFETSVDFMLPPGTPPSPGMAGMGKNGPPAGVSTQYTSTMPGTPTVIRIGSNVMAAKLVNRVEPVYPADAKSAGIEDSVLLEIQIAHDGHVESVDPKEGNPVLAAAAVDAVKQWTYAPTLLNGNPVKVITTVTVAFPN